MISRAEVLQAGMTSHKPTFQDQSADLICHISTARRGGPSSSEVAAKWKERQGVADRSAARAKGGSAEGDN
jgi:cytochrome c551/c552